MSKNSLSALQGHEVGTYIAGLMIHVVKGKKMNYFVVRYQTGLRRR